MDKALVAAWVAMLVGATFVGIHHDQARGLSAFHRAAYVATILLCAAAVGVVFWFLLGRVEVPQDGAMRTLKGMSGERESLGKEESRILTYWPSSGAATRKANDLT
jgi:hypothetical protein